MKSTSHSHHSHQLHSNLSSSHFHKRSHNTTNLTAFVTYMHQNFAALSGFIFEFHDQKQMKATQGSLILFAEPNASIIQWWFAMLQLVSLQFVWHLASIRFSTSDLWLSPRLFILHRGSDNLSRKSQPMRRLCCGRKYLPASKTQQLYSTEF